ncbi:MAG: hypothetical protein Kow0062_11470 [Acidobacteriota bacterium]
MSAAGLARLASRVRLVRLAAVGVAGRRALLVASLPALWPALLKVFSLLGDGGAPGAPAVAGWVLGLPCGVLAVALGCRLVASEVDQRTLEVVYTVPGGARRVWLARFAAGAALVLLGELAAALAAFLMLVDVTAFDLLSSWIGALFLLAVSMLAGALFRSVITGALAAAPVLVLSVLIGGTVRVAPFFSVASLAEYDPADVAAWAFQSRAGFLLATALLVAMAISRAENREAMLRD